MRYPSTEGRISRLVQVLRNQESQGPPEANPLGGSRWTGAEGVARNCNGGGYFFSFAFVWLMYRFCPQGI